MLINDWNDWKIWKISSLFKKVENNIMLKDIFDSVKAMAKLFEI